jgi:hypothetical protein
MDRRALGNLDVYAGVGYRVELSRGRRFRSKDRWPVTARVDPDTGQVFLFVSLSNPGADGAKGAHG